jgi:DNA end-binding protein Ku
MGRDGSAVYPVREIPSKNMRAIWKGSISFGLVNIPVALQTASRSEELKFRLLRRDDLSPVNYKRVAAVDGKEVPWEQIVKGYEYEKDHFVVLKDEDFKRVDIEATDTIDIIDFVDLAEINPVFFYKPYYLEPQKGGASAYLLLRQVLADTNKAGIAKVVIRTRQHLAAVKSNGNLLVLELMRFADELVDPASIKIPDAKVPGKREIGMARALVEQLTEPWKPDRYTDDYRSALMKLIDAKVKSGGKGLPAARAPKRATKVIDLAEVLRQSLRDAGADGGDGSADGASATKSARSAKSAKAAKTAKSAKSARTANNRAAPKSRARAAAAKRKPAAARAA